MGFCLNCYCNEVLFKVIQLIISPLITGSTDPRCDQQQPETGDISQSEAAIVTIDQSEAGTRCCESSMGPQQGPVDSPQLGVSSASPGLSRPRDTEELTSPAPINLYISEAGDYNYSVSGQCHSMFPTIPQESVQLSSSHPSVMLNTCLLFTQVSILSSSSVRRPWAHIFISLLPSVDSALLRCHITPQCVTMSLSLSYLSGGQ